MSVVRNVLALVAVCGGALTTPASAQFYLQSHRFGAGKIVGDEPTMGVPLPGATAAEVRASLVWNLRAALNVAALQCQFEPTLLTVPNYNAVLRDHDVEFDGAQATLTKYFTRVNKTKAAGQSALDQFGTRTYSSFVTVAGQFGFCQTAASIGRDAVFTPRGEFGNFATERMMELRNSLMGAWGEEGLPSGVNHARAQTPRFDKICWSRKGDWNAKKCGPLFLTPPPMQTAAQ